MPNLQLIIQDGRLAAVVIAGHAIIDDTLSDDQRQRVQAMCLYALETQDGWLQGPHASAVAWPLP